MSSILSTNDERRSSVRVKSLLPISVVSIEESDLEGLQSRILDLAVLAEDNELKDKADWNERTDEISRDVLYLLQEVRSLRRHLAEIQRKVEIQQEEPLTPRWVELNSNGLFLPLIDGDEAWSAGKFVEVRVQLPSLQTPEVLAAGEIIRVGEDDGAQGAAMSFKCISAAHSEAILRYALRRERQLARSQRFS